MSVLQLFPPHAGAQEPSRPGPELWLRLSLTKPRCHFTFLSFTFLSSFEHQLPSGLQDAERSEAKIQPGKKEQKPKSSKIKALLSRDFQLDQDMLWLLFLAAFIVQMSYMSAWPPFLPPHWLQLHFISDGLPSLVN